MGYELHTSAGKKLANVELVSGSMDLQQALHAQDAVLVCLPPEAPTADRLAEPPATKRAGKRAKAKANPKR